MGGRSLTGALSGLFYRSSLYRRYVLDGPVPSELRRTFPWHAPGDRTQAEAILGNEFAFAGRRVPFGQMPWSVLPPSTAIGCALHGFTWLTDLKSAGTDEARVRARSLTLGWINTHRRWSAFAWAPEVVGQRLAAWLAAADFVFDHAAAEDVARFLQSAARQARHLARVAHHSRGTAGAFAVAAGEIAAALCLDVTPLAPALQRLEGEIARQILPDGGHVSRNPLVQVQVFQWLVDVHAALGAAAIPTPPTLLGGIERMAPLIRMLRHGDGRLPLFQGAKESDRTLIDSLLAASRVGTPALLTASETGYERMAAGRTLVLVDVGAPFGAEGHASPLAFEMSYGRERLIVNCGAYAGDDARWRAALRSTPAHTTVTVEDATAVAGGWRSSRELHVSSFRQSAGGAIWLEGSHDGYRGRFGVTHRRRLYLGETGGDLRGEDVVEGRSGRSIQARFHLHPDVHPTLADDGASVALRLPSGATWHFFAMGGQLHVEESTYLGSSDQPRWAKQIVLAAISDKEGTRLKWALRHEGG